MKRHNSSPVQITTRTQLTVSKDEIKPEVSPTKRRRISKHSSSARSLNVDLRRLVTTPKERSYSSSHSPRKVTPPSKIKMVETSPNKDKTIKRTGSVPLFRKQTSKKNIPNIGQTSPKAIKDAKAQIEKIISFDEVIRKLSTEEMTNLKEHVQKIRKLRFVCRLIKAGKTQDDECSLKGKELSFITFKNEWNYKSLDFSNNEVSVIPAEIGKMVFLESVNANNNKLTAVPKEIGKLWQLKELYLSKNKLFLYPLPNELFNLPHLQKLVLSHNQMEDLPINLSKLISLTHADYSYNIFKTIPECIMKTTSLVTLLLNHNRISIIPPQFGILVNLRHLEIENNSIKTIPVSFNYLNQMEVLNVKANYVSRFPVLNNVTNLKTLVLSDNPRLLKLDLTYHTNLKTLCLCSTQRLLSIDSLDKLRHLRDLDCSENSWELIENITNELENLVTLKVMKLSGNGLLVLPNLSKLTNLVILDVSSNEFRLFPTSLVHLNDLKKLDISKNQIKELPSDIKLLTRLQSFHICGNKLSELQPEIYTLTSLKKLNLRSNNLISISEEISSLQQLSVLQLDLNQMCMLPSSIGCLTNLIKLTISNNFLKTLPHELYFLTKLDILDYGQNDISIPSDVVGIVSLLEWLKNNKEKKT